MTDQFDPERFEFLSTLTASIHKLVGDPTQSGWSLDSLKADSLEMAEFRKAIEATKAKVLAAKEYHESLPGIDLTEEQQLQKLAACEEELKQKKEQLAKYLQLPIFEQLRHKV